MLVLNNNLSKLTTRTTLYIANYILFRTSILWTISMSKHMMIYDSSMNWTNMRNFMNNSFVNTFLLNSFLNRSSHTRRHIHVHVHTIHLTIHINIDIHIIINYIIVPLNSRIKIKIILIKPYNYPLYFIICKR